MGFTSSRKLSAIERNAAACPVVGGNGSAEELTEDDLAGRFEQERGRHRLDHEGRARTFERYIRSKSGVKLLERPVKNVAPQSTKRSAAPIF